MPAPHGSHSQYTLMWTCIVFPKYHPSPPILVWPGCPKTKGDCACLTTYLCLGFCAEGWKWTPDAGHFLTWLFIDHSYTWWEIHQHFAFISLLCEGGERVFGTPHSHWLCLWKITKFVVWVVCQKACYFLKWYSWTCRYFGVVAVCSCCLVFAMW